MPDLESRSFDQPDETMTPAKGKVDRITLGGKTVARVTLEPGWRWSEHVKPPAGTDSCQRAHLWYILSARLGVKMDDGTELEASPGEILWIAPGHDGWVVGDEPLVAISLDEFVN